MWSRLPVRVLSGLVLVAILPGSLQLVRYQPPRLMPADRDIVIEPGGTLRVRCEGNHPVTWNYSSLARDIADRVTITDGTKQDNPEFPYVSHIEIRDVTFLDVGYQSCHFVGTTSMEARQNVTQVYLFVNDPANLLVKTSDMEFITVTQNQEAVLACRPTHPDVAVTLFKDGREVTDLAARYMNYKQREGFVIYSPVLTFHNGIFECRASRDGARDKMQIFVHFNPASDTVQQPWINAEGAQHAYLGGNFTLECRVHHMAGIFHTLTWSVPGTSTGLKTGRIVQLEQQVEQNSVVPGGQDPTAASHDLRRLLVTDTRVEDEGYYTCHVRDQNGHENSRQEFVPIQDRTGASVQLQTDTTKFVTRTGELLKIVVSISASPLPEVIWYDPEGEEIVNQALKYSVVVRPDDTILQIFDLSLEDMGEYRVVATSPDGNATDSLVFDVTVQAAPSVSVGSNQLFFPVGEEVSLLCSATGWPAPVVGWEFAACATRHQCQVVQDFDDVRYIQTNEERENHSTSPQHKWRIKSTLSLKAKQSGIYRCHATNKFPTSADADAPFFVSDVAGGFGVLPSASQRQVVVGDNVNITCAGSRFAFDGLETISWLREMEGGLLLPVTDAKGIRVAVDQTMYSYQKTLVLTDIQADKSGRYVCSGTNVSGGKNTTDRLVTVKASASPRFLSDSNMDKSATLTFEEGTRGELNCTVSGLPPPTVVWSKDGERLPVAEAGRVRVSEDGQRLLITAAISDDAGTYQCRAQNRVGAVTGSATVDVPGGGANVGLIAGITGFMLLLLIALAACLVWKTKQQKNLQQRLTKTELEAFTNGRMAQFNPNMPIDEQAELLPYDAEWEFPKEKLILGRQIGSGAFGRVVKAEAIGLTPGEERTTVAVKMPKSGSDPNQIRSMMAELKIMIQLGKHLNVVNLLGAVTKHAVDGEFMVMVEYCRHGNLHQYLQRHKTCFIDQVDPITGEYDASLGEEEYEAAMAGGAVSENTPLNLAGGGGGDLRRAGNRLTLASCDSLYKTPRCNSTASSIHSAGYNTDMTAVDSVCLSPGATGGEDSLGVPRLNTGASVRPRRVPLTTRDLLRWSYQVARGMEYLASRKLLHGDLAARNILLAENNIVKISDFGLSRDIYKTRDYRKKGKGLLPVKWMAIESIQESIFSTQSDVWAFGVVMWEFFSLGASPYPGMEYDVNFVRRLRDGYRMERPKFAPQAAYKLMLETWKESPGDRPSFTELAEKIGHSLEERIKEEYMLLNEPFRDLNSDYFARRTDYVNTLASPDYVNVTREQEAPPGDERKPAYVNMDPQRQTAAYRASRAEEPAGGAQAGPDGYLMMTPTVEGGPEGGRIFSPRPTAVVKPFDFPHSGGANHFYNPSYDKPAKAGSRPTSATAAPPREDEDHYLSPRLPEDEDHYLSPRLPEDQDHYLVPKNFDEGGSPV
ncbi:vascular endothelial growth factor receptor 1-like isoform X2 [Amphibalanus amphitrite]|uniref:vascular endothelial growth factor receptor 1-like isoform X2 n=1 Tax=Amphibalanus amphitrite TaxID=1232801 RepID=UPI001C91F7DB|nr:vascular endothelial growth factor receptor 1-like isoform X2 [Amphibalanus amphitrite]